MVLNDKTNGNIFKHSKISLFLSNRHRVDIYPVKYLASFCYIWKKPIIFKQRNIITHILIF